MDLNADILTIQKFIYLLDDFHYNEFRNHLAKINASLPLKLAEVIRARLPGFDTHEELCKKIYGAAGRTQKQNFNQLSSYSFRLSERLANNYPEYLHTNIQKIQALVANQKLDEANFLNARLLELAERVNDFPCAIFALQFMSQQAYMAKDSLRTQKTDRQLHEALEEQQLFYKVRSTLRTVVYATTTPKSEKELEALLKYFDQYTAHGCSSIRVLSQFAYQSTRFHLTTQMYTPKDFERIEKLRKEIRNYPHVVFPFMLDIKGSLEYLLLNSPYVNLFAKETAKEYEELTAHYQSLKFWKNYLNFSELNLIAIQGTKLLSLYHYKVHLSDYQKAIEPEHRVLLHELLHKCKSILARIPEKQNKAFEDRSVKMLHGALLILSGGKHITEGLDELEALLINYQQINFKAATDSIFLCLMVGYFSIKDYDKCVITFKRYLKSIRGKLSYEGNHIKIHAYYYLAQWLSTKSKQYPAKLEALLNEYGTSGSQRTIWELVDHFKLPIDIPEHQIAGAISTTV